MKTNYLTGVLIAMLLLSGAAKSQEHVNIDVPTNDIAEIEKAIAQSESPSSPDTVIINLNERNKVIVVERDGKGRTKEIVYYKKGEKKDRVFSYDVMFDIGLNTYNKKNYFSGSEGNDDFLDLYAAKSVNFAIYPFYGSLRLTKNRILELETGLGFDWHNYRFEDGWTIAKENGVIVASDAYRPSGQNLLSKSKLVTTYLNVPLMLRVNIPISGSYRNSFYVSTGVIGGLKIGSHTKVKYDDGGKKEKERGSFNLNLLKYDLTFRAGYRGVGLYFNYQMTPMFENNKGPELYPYSVGLTFSFR